MKVTMSCDKLSVLLAFVNCYVVNNCYVRIEMLKICRGWFGKSFLHIEIAQMAYKILTSNAITKEKRISI